MQTMEQALAVDRATEALYATASDPYKPRAVKTIVVMVIVAVALLAMVPVLASSMRPSSGERTTAPAAGSQQPTAATAPSGTTPGTSVVYETP